MRVRGHISILVAFSILVAWYTWPLLRHTRMDETAALNFVTMRAIFQNLLTRPAHLFEGPAFYPFGNTLTFSEPLFTPALVLGPLDALTHQPMLAYNLTLLLGWAVSGWAMYAVTLGLTRDHPAAFVAATIFTLCPVRLQFSGVFQMEMLWGVPLVIYGLVRFLERQRGRELVALLAVFWAQAVAVVYVGVVLGFGALVIAVQYVALRWRGWHRRTVLLAILAGAALGPALAPLAGPYFVTRRELGLERRLEDARTPLYSADVLTYLTTTGTWVARIVPIEYRAETSLFIGVSALALAPLSLLWIRRPRQPGQGWLARGLAAAIVVCLGLAVVAGAAGRAIHVGPVRSPFSAAGVAVVLLAVARHGTEGWQGWRQGRSDRTLAEREWVGLLWVLALCGLLLSLGPVAHVAGHPVGGGVFAWLYPLVLPFHAVRITARFGVLVVFALALLAGFGMQALRECLSSPARRVVTMLVPLLLLLDYAGTAVPSANESYTPRAVDAVVRADANDVVVLEWPVNVPGSDAEAMFRWVDHGKRVVNGEAGFVLDFLRDLSGVLSTGNPPLGTAVDQGALRRIYPLRYLIVRFGDPGFPPEERPRYLALRHAPPPLLRFRGTFGSEDLYEIQPLPERGVEIERWVSPDYLRDYPVLHLGLRPLIADPGLEQELNVTLNGRLVRRLSLDEAAAPAFRLAPPPLAVAPNVIGLGYRYRRVHSSRADPRYRIGATQGVSPGDLQVRSIGGPEDGIASIRLNGREVSPNGRGYNLVALTAHGEVLGTASCDTSSDPAAAHRLATWIAALPAGALVAGAVRDEGSARLTGEGEDALRTLGVSGDLRGHYRAAHAFVGVKGAPPGSAVEAVRQHSATVTVGQPAPEGRGVELVDFELRRT